MDPHSDPDPSDETTPLLDRAAVEAQSPAKKQTPLPKAPLAAIFLARLAEPVAYTQLFPYINEYLVLLHVTDDISKIGFYSGLVESTFAVSQTLTSYYWAKLSDRVGRRPIVLTVSAGLAIVTLLFGFCTNLTQIIVARALAGLLAGNIAVYHAILGELTDATNQAVAYPLYAFAWPLGSTIGPLIGGWFSNLGTKYPESWGYDIILAHPYLMPNLVCALLVVAGLVLAFFCLEETLPSKRPGASTTAVVHEQSPELSAMELLQIPMIRKLTISGFILAFIGTAFDVVFVLFCYTPIAQGGLSFSVNQIGYALAISGAILAVFHLLLMPILLRAFLASKVYLTAMALWPVTFFLMPFLNLIARRGYDPDTQLMDPATNRLLWLAIAVVLLSSRVAALTYATNMIMTRDHAPGHSSLGACNGLVQFAMCVSRCFSPAFVSSVFALSIDNNLLGGYPMWVAAMICICLLGVYFAQTMVAEDEKVER
ncbi:major facilitator superfamily domain-containing protein [Mycena filopes]|nr:major facilitator superfamily domain-containing protein [Mycena filopes]